MTDGEPEGMSMLAIRLFGPCEVRREGAALPRLRSRKGYWLLALLTLRHGREVERPWLAGTLWPDSGERSALANLRESLKDLRRALGVAAGRLHSPTPRTLCLDLTGAQCDVVAFDAAIARGDPPSLNAAVSLYRGPLLEGWSEEWIFQERLVREQAYLAALETLAAHAMARGEHVPATRHLQLVAAVEPLRESAQRALMQALAASGDYAAATQTYRDLRLRLHRELNAEPDSATSALFQQLRAEAIERGREGAREGGRGIRAVPSGQAPCRHNLPVPPTPLLGREGAIAAVSDLLRRDDVRLVTLTGPAGVGKTRLGFAVAAELLDDMERVFWVNLAHLTDAGQVAGAIAQTLGVRERDGAPLLDLLKQYLREKRMLLMLDNFEHVLEAAPLAAELLAFVPGLRVLVTSRAALQLRGERESEVAPLALPDRQRPATVEDAARYAALELFVQRAQDRQPGFRVTEENAAAVAGICRRLDGLPLAIELAAAHVKLFPPPALFTRLENRLKVLTGGVRDLPARQQTLRNAIAWSYDLLDAEEQTLFRRLSVFVDGGTLEAAEAVCGEGCRVWGVGCREDANPQLATLHPYPVLDLLASLVNQSLVHVEERTGEPRFGMLETIREYGCERLEESGERISLRRQHAGFFVELAGRAEGEMRGPQQGMWLDRLSAELGNLRAALDTLEGGGQPALALQLAVSLAHFWSVRGLWSEGRERLTRLLALSEAQEPTPPRAGALHTVASLTLAQGEHGAARVLCEESLALARELGDRRSAARALNTLGRLAHLEDDYSSAMAHHQESLAIWQELGDRGGIAEVLSGLGGVAYRQEEYERAQAYYEESLTIERLVGDERRIAGVLFNLGLVAQRQRDDETAQTCYEQSLEMGRKLGDKELLAFTLRMLGMLACRRGEDAVARALYEESLALRRELGNPATLAFALHSLGGLAYQQRDYRGARAFFREGLRRYQEFGGASLRTGMAGCLAGLARVTAAQGRAEQAARLFGAAEALDRRSGALPPIAELTATRTALGEDAFAAAWAEGEAMTLDQAIACALEDVSPGQAE